MSLSIKPTKVLPSTKSFSELELMQFSFLMNYVVDFFKDKVRLTGIICFQFVGSQCHKTLILSVVTISGL